MSQGHSISLCNHNIISPPATPKRSVEAYFHTTGQIMQTITSYYQNLVPSSPNSSLSSSNTFNPSLSSSWLQDNKEHQTQIACIAQPLSSVPIEGDQRPYIIPSSRQKLKPASSLCSQTKGAFMMPIESLFGLQRNTKTLRRKSHFISLRSTMKKKKKKKKKKKN
jgi:hypothetical protein